MSDIESTHILTFVSGYRGSFSVVGSQYVHNTGVLHIGGSRTIKDWLTAKDRFIKISNNALFRGGYSFSKDDFYDANEAYQMLVNSPDKSGSGKRLVLKESNLAINEGDIFLKEIKDDGSKRFLVNESIENKKVAVLATCLVASKLEDDVSAQELLDEILDLRGSFFRVSKWG